MATQIQTQIDAVTVAPPHSRLRRHAHFTSDFLPGEREITVYLPPGYDAEPDRAYPLLVMHDGQNLFSPDTSFVQGRSWRLAEHADAAIAAGEVEPLIIAGIAHAGERRLAEYTPSRDWKLGGGEAERYAAPLTRELLPFLRARYRLRGERENTALGGSSLGGLVSLWLGLTQPDTFGKLAVLSPSVWWNHRYIVSFLNETAPHLLHRPRIWLDVGDAEGVRNVADTELLHSRLLRHGWRPGRDLHFEKIAGGTHDECAWSERVWPMLRFLFPGQKLKQELKTSTLSADHS